MEVKQRDVNKEHRPKLGIWCLSLIALLLVVPVGAIDHPADYIHLNIPNPIPDADPRYFLAGGLCAAASHGLTTPIDVVKTRMQASPGKYGNVVSAIVEILRVDGNKALLKGFGPTVVGYGIEGGTKFGLYESLKPELARLFPFDNPAFPYLIASIAAGAVASLMLCPMERIRIRSVTDPKFASGFVTGITQLVEESGIRVLFSGLSAMLSKQVPYTFGKQVAFDWFARFLHSVSAAANLGTTTGVNFEVSFVAAFLASILACVLSQPGDVILTATFKNPQANASFTDAVSALYRAQGFKAFFSGISARFLHVGTIITSQLVLYDVIKQLLGLPATGAT